MAAQREERRLAAILSADVVGYSRLMGADESGTLARLNNLAAIYQAQGRTPRPSRRISAR